MSAEHWKIFAVLMLWAFIVSVFIRLDARTETVWLPVAGKMQCVEVPR